VKFCFLVTFPCMYICITTQIGLSPLFCFFFFFLLWSP
jgi:hypothetical protein